MARVVVPVTEVTPPKATLTTALAGTHNDLTFTAQNGGPGGNGIEVEYIVAGASTPLSIVVVGTRITVNVATSSGSAAISTASQVKAAIDANVDAIRLVSVALAAGNDGSGVVAALAATALAGGSLATTPPTAVDGDATNDHYFTGNDGLTELEVVSTDAGSQTVSIEYSPSYAPLTDLAAEVVTVPAGATRKIGPFSKSAFDQNGAGDVYFNPSVSTTLKFRAYRYVRAV